MAQRALLGMREEVGMWRREPCWVGERRWVYGAESPAGCGGLRVNVSNGPPWWVGGGGIYPYIPTRVYWWAYNPWVYTLVPAPGWTLCSSSLLLGPASTAALSGCVGDRPWGSVWEKPMGGEKE